MQTTTIGIDLAKQFFQVHGVNEFGKTVLKKQLRRQQMAEFFVNLPPCLIGMEACGSAHHWARKLQSMGHTVRLMAPQFVKPYVKTNKNDAADAEAICEAVARPNMRFVPLKDVAQQSVLALHRARQGFVKARTAQANQIRGLLAEFGEAVFRLRLTSTETCCQRAGTACFACCTCTCASDFTCRKVLEDSSEAERISRMAFTLMPLMSAVVFCLPCAKCRIASVRTVASSAVALALTA